VLAVVIVDPITAEMDAGDEAILGKLEEPGGSVQFCAFAPEAANNDNATAIPGQRLQPWQPETVCDSSSRHPIDQHDRRTHDRALPGSRRSCPSGGSIR
jgi:hypothetical protein